MSNCVRNTLVGIVVLTFLILALRYAMVHWDEEFKRPIKVGVSTTLTGKASAWGIRSRNGIILAAEHVNKAGGINGRRVELIIKDDKGDPSQAAKVDQELIDEGAVAILGHFLSTVAAEAIPLANENRIVMLSLGTHSPDFSGKDDYFFRTTVPEDVRAIITARHAYHDLKLRKMAVVYDLSNPKYTLPSYECFRDAFEKEGGAPVKGVGFDPREKFSAPEIATELRETGIDGLVLLSTGIHGALICQHLKRTDPDVMVFAKAWTFTDPEFIKNGGRSVEGTRCFSIFNAASREARFLEFKREYESRFGDEVNGVAQTGYEVATILFDALKKEDSPKSLKETILKQRVFKGLNEDIVIDEYGDPIRPLYVLEIKDGEIRTLRKLGQEARK